MVSKVFGFEDVSDQISKLGKTLGGRVLRRAAMQGTLPALRAAQAAAPVGDPPYEGKDPYPVRAYTGRLRTPGFLKRNIGRKSFVSFDKRTVTVLIGPKAEAFYGTQFIELGTSKIPRRPWLEPSFRRSIPKINKRFAERLVE